MSQFSRIIMFLVQRTGSLHLHVSKIYSYDYNGDYNLQSQMSNSISVYYYRDI